MGERVVPFAVQPPLQLLCGWQLVILWELQLIFFEQQIKYLLCLGHVEVKALHKPLLFDPLARNRVCPPESTLLRPLPAPHQGRQIHLPGPRLHDA